MDKDKQDSYALVVENEELRAQLEALMSDAEDERQATVAAFADKLAARDAALEKAKDAITTLRASLEAAQADAVRLQERISIKETETQELRLAVKQVTEERDLLTRQATTSEARAQELEKQLQAMHTTLTRAMIGNDNCAKLKAENEELKTRAIAHRRAIARLAAYCRKLEGTTGDYEIYPGFNADSL